MDKKKVGYKIVKYERIHTKEMADLYSLVYDFCTPDQVRIVYQYFNKNKLKGFIAQIDNNLLGGVLFDVKDVPYSNGRCMFIETIQIKPEYQRMGIGSALFKKAIEYCKSHKIGAVEFLVDKNIKSNIQWYKHFGMKTDGWIGMYSEIINLITK